MFEKVLRSLQEKVRMQPYVMTIHWDRSMICDVCGQEGAQIRRISRVYGKGADLLVIENVPLVSCPHCGESYLVAETLHEIEQIKANRHRLAVKSSVEVADFARVEQAS